MRLRARRAGIRLHPPTRCGRSLRDLQSAGIRVSVFVDPDPDAVRWAAALGGDRDRALHRALRAGLQGGCRSRRATASSSMPDAATLAHELGLGVNAGHDLDLDNLVLFRNLPHLDEASIGHALISHALYVGLERAVGDYLRRSRGDRNARLHVGHASIAAMLALLLVFALEPGAAATRVTLRTDDGSRWRRPGTSRVQARAGGDPRSHAEPFAPRLGGACAAARCRRASARSQSICAVTANRRGADRRGPAAADYSAMVLDVKAARRFLAQRSDVQQSRVGIAGASIGANLAALSGLDRSDRREPCAAVAVARLSRAADRSGAAQGRRPPGAARRERRRSVCAPVGEGAAESRRRHSRTARAEAGRPRRIDALARPGSRPCAGGLVSANVVMIDASCPRNR